MIIYALILLSIELDNISYIETMGTCATKVCGSDMFQKMFDQYGDDIAKFISIEKSKVYIDQKFEELKKQIS